MTFTKTFLFVVLFVAGCQVSRSHDPAPVARDMVCRSQASASRSIEARASALLENWLDAQNRLDRKRFNSLYKDFDGFFGNYDRGTFTDNESFRLCFPIDSGCDTWGRRVSLEQNEIEIRWDRPHAGLHFDDETYVASMALTLRYASSNEISIVNTLLLINFSAPLAQIVWQVNSRSNDCQDMKYCPPSKVRVPAKVRLSCSDCPPSHPVYEADIMNDCRRSCAISQDERFRDSACLLVAKSYLLGTCGVTQDLVKGFKYLPEKHGSERTEIANLLLARSSQTDANAALHLLGCYPQGSRLIAKDCLSGVDLELLWNTGRPEWQQAALNFAMSNCPEDLSADPCHENDWACLTAANFLESGKLGKARSELANEHRLRVKNRWGVCEDDD